jgi:hypothetical protein
MNKISAALTLVLLFSAFCLGGEAERRLAAIAVSSDSATAGEAIRELRSRGQGGLDAMFEQHAGAIAELKKTGKAGEDWKRIATAIDTVAMQKDAYTSRLYWYTDLDEAKRAARASGKPILSLRLLGNLNEEFSCANSRLFRSVLYANREVSDYLRSNYILHWKSVRNAPRITIDFGDGRKIERTITGNSIHYVLDAEGRIIDGIPGLYTPSTFLGYVRRAHDANAETLGKSVKERQKGLLEFRQKSFNEIKKNRTAAIEKAGVTLTETRTGSLAILAAPMAVAKMVVVDEYSILRVYDDFAKFEPSIKFDDWDKLAKVYAPDAGLDEQTVAMIGRQVATTGLTADELKSMFAKLTSYASLDTTRNDFLFHTKIYEWLNRQRTVEDVEGFNALVYDKLFQTPNTDKWLGLYSSDVYTALDGNGIVK